jgi:hypothetical protein
MGRLLNKSIRSAGLFLLLVLVGLSASASNSGGKESDVQVFKLNLAKDTTKEFDLDPGTMFRVELMNALPSQKYTIRYKSDNFESPPLPLFFSPPAQQSPQSEDDKKAFKTAMINSNKGADTSALKAQIAEIESSSPILRGLPLEKAFTPKKDKDLKCKDVYDSLVNFLSTLYSHAKTEDQIRPLQDSIAIALGRINAILRESFPCKNDTGFESYCANATRALYAKSVIEQDTVLNITKGQMIEVIVSRPDSITVTLENGGRKIPYTREWHFYFFSGRKSDFEIVYGFDFITHGSSHTKEYFLRKSGDSGSVIASNDPQGYKDLDFSPTVFAAWFPRKPFFGGGARFGFLAGLSSNNSSVAVSVGGLFSWHKNIGIALGWTAHKQDVLKPEYEGSDHRFVRDIADVKNVLRQVYKLDPFFGVVLRLN